MDANECVRRNSTSRYVLFQLVPGVGLEPTCLTAPDLKSSADTNFATRAGEPRGAGENRTPDAGFAVP